MSPSLALALIFNVSILAHIGAVSILWHSPENVRALFAVE